MAQSYYLKATNYTVNVLEAIIVDDFEGYLLHSTEIKYFFLCSQGNRTHNY